MADSIRTPTPIDSAPVDSAPFDLERIWQAYVAAWNTPNPEAKRALLGAAVAAHCTYTDPLTQCSGWDELITAMLDFHRQVPGAHFVTSRFLALADRSVASWEMWSAQGAVMSDGISYGEYDDSGKLRVMNAFYQVPSS